MSAITPEENHIAEAVGERTDNVIVAATEEPKDGTLNDDDKPAYLEG